MYDEQKKRGAINLLRQLKHQSSENILIQSSKVHRIYYNDYDRMTIVYRDGTTGLASNADFKTLDEAVRKHMGFRKEPRYDLYY